MEADRFRGTAVDPGAGRIKLIAYIESWIDARQLAPRTVELYGYMTQRSISSSLGDMAINRLTPDAVRRWHKDIATTQSPIQAAKAYRLLRAVLNTAVADGLIGQNPCRIPGAGQERSAERPAVTPDVVFELAARSRRGTGPSSSRRVRWASSWGAAGPPT